MNIPTLASSNHVGRGRESKDSQLGSYFTLETWKTQTNSRKNNYRPDFTYADFAPKFTAEFYDANEWADILEASGAK
jgi:alpha-L-fucosidase